MRMVEKVARALFACEGMTYADDERMFEPYPFEEIDEIELAGFMDRARAAIEAMRVPDDEMWSAAWIVYHPWGVNAPDTRDRPNAFDAMKEKTSALLSAMIDKALEDGE